MLKLRGSRRQGEVKATRVGLALVLMLVLLALSPSGTAGQESPPRLALVGVSHTLDGGSLIVTGWVENRGPAPVSRLVVDVAGFAPSGELVTQGSDGIPWEIAPGASEHFSVELSVPNQLIRDYSVQVSFVRPGSRPLASLRGSPNIELYRPLMLSRVSAKGSVLPGELFVRAMAPGMPIATVTVEATLVLVPFTTDRSVLPSLETLTLDVPAGGSISVPLPVRDAFLVTLRVVNLLLKASW